MAKFSIQPQYSERFIKALQLAAQWHQYQQRKQGTAYIGHLLSVSALVIENKGSEDAAIAALLHDAVEDVNISLKEIQEHFGSRVAEIVGALSEDKNVAKEVRKKAYVEKIIELNDKEVTLVAACDKLHNIRCYANQPELCSVEVQQFYGHFLTVPGIPEEIKQEIEQIYSQIWN